MAATAEAGSETEGGPPAALSSNLAWLLAQASHAITAEMTAAFEGLGVSPRAHCVLSAAMSGKLTQKDLADAVGIDKTTMVVTLDELERVGLARRLPSSTDRRARIIAVTEAGEEFVARGEQLAGEIQRDVLGSLPARERAALMHALSSLVCDRLAEPAACERAPRRPRA